MENYNIPNVFYHQRTDALCAALAHENIPFEREPLFGGCIVYFPNKAECRADVILHNGSYGREMGCFEAMGEICSPEIQEIDDVEVIDTIEEVVERARKFKTAK